MAHAQPDAKSVLLWPDLPPASAVGDAFKPWMDLFLIDTPAPRGLVVVCPGGGYGQRAAHESDSIAQAFNAAGLHAAVVQYRVSPHRHPAPLLDVARAVRLLRRDAAKLNIDAERIAVCCFSAGGHLAASLGVHHAQAATPGDEWAAIACKPNALVLCYPVISAAHYPHQGSIKNLLGERQSDPAWIEFMSLEKHVTADTPPTFLWHTVEDAAVAIENALLFAQALRQHKVLFELHCYPHGRHGLGLSPQDSHVATWISLARGFFQALGWLPRSATA